jgi:hypothetical protein
MIRRSLTYAAAGLLGLGALAGPARADEDSELREKIKQQMEKIVQLMRENEKALLVASTGGAADPKSPDVTVPAGEESPASDPGAKGEEIRRRIEEALTGQGRKASGIPRELEELVKMIPT